MSFSVHFQDSLKLSQPTQSICFNLPKSFFSEDMEMLVNSITSLKSEICNTIVIKLFESNLGDKELLTELGAFYFIITNFPDASMEEILENFQKGSLLKKCESCIRELLQRQPKSEKNALYLMFSKMSLTKEGDLNLGGVFAAQALLDNAFQVFFSEKDCEVLYTVLFCLGSKESLKSKIQFTRKASSLFDEIICSTLNLPSKSLGKYETVVILLHALFTKPAQPSNEAICYTIGMLHYMVLNFPEKLYEDMENILSSANLKIGSQTLWLKPWFENFTSVKSKETETVSSALQAFYIETLKLFCLNAPNLDFHKSNKEIFLGGLVQRLSLSLLEALKVFQNSSNLRAHFFSKLQARLNEVLWLKTCEDMEVYEEKEFLIISTGGKRFVSKLLKDFPEEILDELVEDLDIFQWLYTQDGGQIKRLDDFAQLNDFLWKQISPILKNLGLKLKPRELQTIKPKIEETIFKTFLISRQNEQYASFFKVCEILPPLIKNQGISSQYAVSSYFDLQFQTKYLTSENTKNFLQELSKFRLQNNPILAGMHSWIKDIYFEKSKEESEDFQHTLIISSLSKPFSESAFENIGLFAKKQLSRLISISEQKKILDEFGEQFSNSNGWFYSLDQDKTLEEFFYFFRFYLTKNNERCAFRQLMETYAFTLSSSAIFSDGFLQKFSDNAFLQSGRGNLGNFLLSRFGTNEKINKLELISFLKDQLRFEYHLSYSFTEVEEMVCQALEIPFSFEIGNLLWESARKKERENSTTLIVKLDLFENKLAFYQRDLSLMKDSPFNDFEVNKKFKFLLYLPKPAQPSTHLLKRKVYAE